MKSPPLLFTVLLVSGVVLVNGWTDAPNAIATCVCTRSLSPGKAIGMAAVCNFLGIFAVTALNANVAQTLFHLVDFGTDTHRATVCLCAAMVAIVLWAVFAWYFGIPTSESHALIAGLTGAAVAFGSGFQGVNAAEWRKVLYGLLLSTVLGVVTGYGAVSLLRRKLPRYQRVQTQARLRYAQIFAGGAMAFFHGAQDGQKFMAVFLLGIFLSQGQMAENFAVPVWLMLVCAGLMAGGTLLGGKRIIKSVGMDMVHLERYEGCGADLAGAFCLLLATFTGLPVSTTHVKTMAMVGVSLRHSPRKVKWQLVGEMMLAWIFTFPGCGLLGWGAALAFMKWF